MTVRYTEGSIVAALRASLFASPAHVVLEQVRNGTGYGKRERYADAIAVSLYPSRGIWLAGVEVKVYRNDWLRELNDPDKAEEIARFCDYWWLATAPDVAQEDEVPEPWGLVVVTGKKAKVVRKATKREPQALTPPFVASILRNASGALDAARQAGHEAGYAAAVERYGSDALEQAREEAAVAIRARDMALRDQQHAEGMLRRYEGELEVLARELGIESSELTHHYGNKRDLARRMKIAQLVERLQPETFRAVAEELVALQGGETS